MQGNDPMLLHRLCKNPVFPWRLDRRLPSNWSPPHSSSLSIEPKLNWNAMDNDATLWNPASYNRECHRLLEACKLWSFENETVKQKLQTQAATAIVMDIQSVICRPLLSSFGHFQTKLNHKVKSFSQQQIWLWSFVPNEAFDVHCLLITVPSKGT